LDALVAAAVARYNGSLSGRQVEQVHEMMCKDNLAAIKTSLPRKGGSSPVDYGQVNSSAVVLL
jgi:hypothetical protein